MAYYGLGSVSHLDGDREFCLASTGRRLQVPRLALVHFAERAAAQERRQRQLLAPDVRQRRDIFVSRHVTVTSEIRHVYREKKILI